MTYSTIETRPETEVCAYIGLGANLGDCLQTLRRAAEMIGRFPLTRVVAVSHFYLTEPVDAPGPDYTNAVLGVSTRLSALELLHALQDVESDFKRVRPSGVYHAPRTLDLDLLTYGSLESVVPELILPHPRMQERAFVLVPLSEIAAKDFSISHRLLEAYLPKVSTQRIRRLDAELLKTF